MDNRSSSLPSPRRTSSLNWGREDPRGRRSKRKNSKSYPRSLSATSEPDHRGGIPQTGTDPSPKRRNNESPHNQLFRQTKGVRPSLRRVDRTDRPPPNVYASEFHKYSGEERWNPKTTPSYFTTLPRLRSLTFLPDGSLPLGGVVHESYPLSPRTCDTSEGGGPKG